MVKRLRCLFCLAFLCFVFCCSVSAYDGNFLGLSPGWSSFIEFPAYGNALDKEVVTITRSIVTNAVESIKYESDYVTVKSEQTISSIDYYITSDDTTVSLYYSGCNVTSDDGIVTVNMSGISNKWTAPTGYFCNLDSNGNFVYEKATRLSYSRADDTYTSTLSAQFKTDVTPGIWSYFVVYMSTNGGQLSKRVNNLYTVTTTYHYVTSDSGYLTPTTLSSTDSSPASTRGAGVVSSVSYNLQDEASKMIVEDMTAKKDTAEDIGSTTSEETITDTQGTLSAGIDEVDSFSSTASSQMGDLVTDSFGFGQLMTVAVPVLFGAGDELGYGPLYIALLAIITVLVLTFIIRRLL